MQLVIHDTDMAFHITGLRFENSNLSCDFL